MPISNFSTAIRAFLAVMRQPKLDSSYLKVLEQVLPSIAQGFTAAQNFPVAAGSCAMPPTGSSPLARHFDSVKEGPGIWKWTHYFDAYHSHFKRFVGTEISVMEVGIYSGGSLPMWREYFGPHCALYGVDIEAACKSYEQPDIKVYIGDQEDRDFWRKIKSEVPRLDILIDDGGHTPEQQRATLEEMLPHLAPGGVFICEDIHGANNEFCAYVQGLCMQLHAAKLSDATTAGITSPAGSFQGCYASVHQYPFMTVIEKRLKPVGALYCPKHGTEWQPFYGHEAVKRK